ncbi:MAG: FAD-binding protein [Armatimonadetes bacterium]|nr:FAD-binding protein [Armatimonadota bacterium]
MSRVLIVCFDRADSLAAIGFGQASGKPFDILQLTQSAAEGTGAEKIYSLGLPTFPPADYLANALSDFAKEYTWIAGVSNMRSKDVLARLAGKLDCAMVTDVLSIESEDTFTRPIVAGAIIATVQVHATPVVLTFRTSGFKAQPTDKASEVIEHKFDWQGVTKRLSENSRGGGRPDLAQAKVVVSGGRPLKDTETFEKVIGGLADKLGGAVGATRAAVDSGIAANELQVGQTGKIVAPDLYIAAGISGSTQHMAGIKDSKVIVAINTDPDAPIFDVADYGLVQDLFEAVPELTDKL